MSGDEGSSSNQKPYGMVNIKTHVPIILDFNELNYDAWRELFETHCRGYRVLGFLTGTSTPKSDKDEEWYTLDSIVKSWIYATLTQSLLTSIVKKNSTAHSVWQSLEDLVRENKDTHAIELENVRFTTQCDLSVAQYRQKMKGISDLLANIDNSIPENTFVAHLLNGLSPQYDNIYMLLRHKDPLPTYNQTRSKLIVEETRLKTNCPTQASHSDHSSSSTVLYAGHNQRAPSHSNRGGRRPNQPRRGCSNSDQRRQQTSRSGHQHHEQALPWYQFPMPWQPFPWPYTPYWPHFRPAPGNPHQCWSTGQAQQH
ncbi:unnamed protein product [Lactuca virosa]|uniref:Retrotransposon Copia-like N-terminal domain-containing protein n=1 Tax=Lactuca virosa TaxID=75947 RepID=A0AAU9NSA3_9ASTR|nr:unnamed protein product [Lactuca virosa]